MSCFEAYLLCLHFNGVWTASDFPVNSRQKKRFLAEEWDCKRVQMISAVWLCKQQSLGRFGRDFSAWVNFDGVPIRDISAVGRYGSISI